MTFRFLPLCEAAVLNPKPKLPKGVEAPFVEMSDLQPGRRWAYSSTTKQASGGARFQAGDTLFARITPCLENGKIAQYKHNSNEVSFGSTEFIVMRGREGLSTNDFIHFLARDPEFRSKAESLMSGTSGRQRVNLEALAAYEIPLPSLDIQEEIAAILNPLDQKIELNRQIARSLEELAQRLFKSWFVDFDPVRAKMAGRQPAHTPPEIADLFPDRLVDSPLGPIPAGWSIEYLSNITSINSESYTAKLLPPSIDYVDISSVGQGWCEGVTRLTKDEAPSRAKRVAKPGDTIWSMVRPNRRAHFYFDAQFSASTVISTGFAVIRPQLAPTFTYFLTDQEEFSRYLERRATGAAYPAVNGKVISEFEFVWPGQQLAVAFDRIAASIKERQASLRLENQTLEELRDRLLPKLISGEIRVPEAQEMAEESAS